MCILCTSAGTINQLINRLVCSDIRFEDYSQFPELICTVAVEP